MSRGIPCRTVRCNSAAQLVESRPTASVASDEQIPALDHELEPVSRLTDNDARSKTASFADRVERRVAMVVNRYERKSAVEDSLSNVALLMSRYDSQGLLREAQEAEAFHVHEAHMAQDRAMAASAPPVVVRHSVSNTGRSRDYPLHPASTSLGGAQEGQDDLPLHTEALVAGSGEVQAQCDV